MIEQARARKRREMLRNREDLEARLAKVRAKEKAQRERYLQRDQKYKKRKTDAGKTDATDDDEEQFVLDDYDSDAAQSGPRKGEAAGSGLSASTLELMEKLGMNINGPKEEEVEAEDEMKVMNYPLTIIPILI
jgi:chromosome transmission fidelity protein 1